MAFLIGLMLGSIVAVWPFKAYAMAADRRFDFAESAREAMLIDCRELGLHVL